MKISQINRVVLLLLVFIILLASSSCGFGNEYKTTANSRGNVVYVNPNAAFKQAKKDYNKLFELTQKQFNLQPIDENNWQQYSKKIWEVETDDKDILNQINEASVFFDIFRADVKK